MQLNIKTAMLVGVVLSLGWVPLGAKERPPRVSQPRAIEIARQVALANGIQLEHYQLAESSHARTGDRTGWVIAFECRPQPAPPGCGFLVHVNWNSGKAQLLMGQ
jgi:hypothetical protein